ncbi:hypothetical protein H6B16_006680 [Caecibacteroides pullorum]|nr:hypothetical protein [Caecibacteroides pullorum]
MDMYEARQRKEKVSRRIENATRMLNKEKITVVKSILQGVWVIVSETGHRLNLLDVGNGIYKDMNTGLLYEVVDIVEGNIYVKRHLSRGMPELREWTKNSTGIRAQTPFGEVSATHKRGAPKIGSRASNYGGFSMGDKYVEYIKALRSGGKSDREIANALLQEDGSVLSSDGEKRGAAMLYSTIYLAEEWRKHGAAKLYRGELTRIAQGEDTLDDFLQKFKFISSADEGRKQVGRFHDVQSGVRSIEDLSEDEQEIWNALSPTVSDDFSSDEEERARKEDAVKKKRIFYTQKK